MSSTSLCSLRRVTSQRVTLAAMATLLTLTAPLGAVAANLSAVPAQAGGGTSSSAFDGVVEAVRQTVVAAQVAGAVVQLETKVGDRVAAGQVLMRLDARAAEQTAAASDAQVLAARAALDLASRDFDRQKQLYTDNYISKAALERAESEFKATQAQVTAQLAQSGAARTQSGLFIVKAPFAGVVSEVPVQLGDMAMPGRPLLTLYDPVALRVTAAVPQSVSVQMVAGQVLQIELPGLSTANQKITPAKVQVLPTVDAATHTVQLRASLPANLAGVAPGMFARVWLPMAGARSGTGAAALSVATSAVVRRAELTALYVLGTDGKPVLRQVRLGRVDGSQVEVLSGLMPGEQVVSDPQAAARVR
jgi:RND family efflux transporter MFP subunit